MPADTDRDLLALLESLGLCHHAHGRWVFDERHLCHSPQERLFFRGHWYEGLLPVPDDDPAALDAYRRFSAAVATASREAGFALPTATVPWTPAHAALDAVTMRSWLDAQDLHHPLLRAYLDYCCRDDYGAGLGQVSAWAGLNYFASRHGFHAPGAEAAIRAVSQPFPSGHVSTASRSAASAPGAWKPWRLAK